MEPQPETVWVLVDGVGQPCLHFVRHEKPGANVQVESDQGPHKWVKYRLTPEVAQ